VIVYAVVLSDMSCAADLFIDRRDAEAALAAMLQDEPEWESLGSIEELDFSGRDQLAGLLGGSSVSTSETAI
jgi:hypothetical protein